MADTAHKKKMSWYFYAKKNNRFYARENMNILGLRFSYYDWYRNIQFGISSNVNNRFPFRSPTLQLTQLKMSEIIMTQIKKVKPKSKKKKKKEKKKENQKEWIVNNNIQVSRHQKLMSYLMVACN